MRTRSFGRWVGLGALVAITASTVGVGCDDAAGPGATLPDGGPATPPVGTAPTAPPTGGDAAPDGPNVVEFDSGSQEDASEAGPSIDAAPDAPPPFSGCAAGAVAQSFGNKLWGCAGSVAYADRANLCNQADKCVPATMAFWERYRGGQVPTHHYWVGNPIGYGGTGPGACWVGAVGDPGIYDCGATTPMRLCVPPALAGQPSVDPLGNTCNWTACAATQGGPANYYGGCANNLTAGALCICP